MADRTPPTKQAIDPLPPPPVPPPPDGAAVVPEPAPGTADRSVGDLLSELTSETSLLVRQEVALAKTEIRQELATAGKNVGYVLAGGAVAYAGLITLLVGLGWLLGEILGGIEWLGLTLVGLVVAIVGAVLVRNGLETLRDMNPAPEHTIDSLKEDKAWLKNETH